MSSCTQVYAKFYVELQKFMVWIKNSGSYEKATVYQHVTKEIALNLGS